jgi:hypothetical protein
MEIPNWLKKTENLFINCLYQRDYNSAANLAHYALDKSKKPYFRARGYALLGKAYFELGKEEYEQLLIKAENYYCLLNPKVDFSRLERKLEIFSSYEYLRDNAQNDENIEKKLSFFELIDLANRKFVQSHNSYSIAARLDYESAGHIYHEVLYNEIQAHLVHAGFLFDLGKLQKASEASETACSLANYLASENTSGEVMEILSYSHYSMGNLLKSQGHYPKAKKHYILSKNLLTRSTFYDSGLASSLEEIRARLQ